MAADSTYGVRLKAQWPERVFLSMKEFQEADERRATSKEVDYGARWGRSWPYYRVSWIEATGEVYAFEHGPSAHVVILGHASTRLHVDQALGDWFDHCIEGVAWVEYMLKRYAVQHPEAIPEGLGD